MADEITRRCTECGSTAFWVGAKDSQCAYCKAANKSAVMTDLEAAIKCAEWCRGQYYVQQGAINGLKDHIAELEKRLWNLENTVLPENTVLKEADPEYVTRLQKITEDGLRGSAVPKSVTITVKYKAGHTYDHEYTKTDMYCPICGNQSLMISSGPDWVEEGEGDFYAGVTHMCWICGANFDTHGIEPSRDVGTNETDKQIWSGLMEAENAQQKQKAGQNDAGSVQEREVS